MEQNSEIIIYQTEANETHIQIRLHDKTGWLNRHQMADLFDGDLKTVKGPIVAVSSWVIGYAVLVNRSSYHASIHQNDGVKSCEPKSGSIDLSRGLTILPNSTGDCGLRFSY